MRFGIDWSNGNSWIYSALTVVMFAAAIVGLWYLFFVVGAAGYGGGQGLSECGEAIPFSGQFVECNFDDMLPPDDIFSSDGKE